MNKIYYVYIHIRLDINEPFYVGMGKGDRFKNYHRRNKYWNNIYNKCNKNIKSEIVYNNLTEDEALLKETEVELDLINKGYKLTNIAKTGVRGPTGHKKSQEWKDNYSKLMSNINKGRILTEEHKDNLSKSHKKFGSKPWVGESRLGKKQSLITSQRKSEKLKGRKQTQEEKDKRSLAKKGIPNKNIRKPVLQFDKNNNFIKEWNSIREAEDFYSNGKKNTSISSCCRGNIKTAYKYIWKFKI